MRKLKTTIVKDPFGVRDIPDVMRDKLGWEKSAELMKKWFSLDAKVMSEDEKTGKGEFTYDTYDEKYVDKELFTWEWLEQFDRVKKGLEELEKKKIYDLEKIKSGITKSIKNYIKNNKITQFPTFIKSSDYNNDPAKLHEPWQFQFKTFTFNILNFTREDMDDLAGSLGGFGIYAAVSEARIDKINNNIYKITISNVVFYMKDTFDFIGDQYLGHWNYEGVDIDKLDAGVYRTSFGLLGKSEDFKESIGEAYTIGNSNFNEYRQRNKKGGDLLLFSDLKEVDLVSKPIILTVEIK